MENFSERGRETMVDVVEAVVYTQAKKGVIPACKIILENNSKRYYKPKPVATYHSVDEDVRSIDIRIHHTNKPPEIKKANDSLMDEVSPI